MNTSNPFSDANSGENPYAAPATSLPPVQTADMAHWIWRDGRCLVMHKQAVLPPICVKTNLPTDGATLKRVMYWHAPAWYALILISPLVYIVAALIVRKTATVHVGLSDPQIWRRRAILLGSWLMAFISVGMIIVPFTGVDPQKYGVLALFGLIGLLLSGILGGLLCRIVAPRRISDEYVWLRGVHREYLQRFPVWEFGDI